MSDVGLVNIRGQIFKELPYVVVRINHYLVLVFGHFHPVLTILFASST